MVAVGKETSLGGGQVGSGGKGWRPRGVPRWHLSSRGPGGVATTPAWHPDNPRLRGCEVEHGNLC